ncbi:MAG: tetratricopeptide repeat protein [Saprospiraceae bacterium]|nr:tetratricopeptide repeat protein [Saprospiraceae bacterium]
MMLFYKKLWLWITLLGMTPSLLGQASPQNNLTSLQDSFQIVPINSEKSLPFFKAAINGAGTMYVIPKDRRDQLIAYKPDGQILFTSTKDFSQGIDLIADDQSVFILDQKEKQVLRFDAVTGKLMGNFGDAVTDKIKKPVSLGFIQGQILLFDAGKNNAHFFDPQGKLLKTITLNGVQSPESAWSNQRDAFFVWDDKINAILKYDQNGKPSPGILRLGTGKPDEIQHFIVDPLGFLIIQNQSTKQIEVYQWLTTPQKLAQVPGVSNSMMINPKTYQLFAIDGDNKFSTYQIKVTPPQPENVYGFDIEDKLLIVNVKPLNSHRANRYGLLTYAVDGSDSLAYTTGGTQFIVDEQTVYKGKSRRYKLVYLNPSGWGKPTNGFDNFFGLGNYLKTNNQYEESMIAYQNALRYMGRPQKMVQFISRSLYDMGRLQLNKNTDLIKGLNLLKSAYNLNPRNAEIQQGLTSGYQILFWKLASQENYSTILDETEKVVSQTFLKPFILATVDSVAAVLENIPNTNTLTHARIMRLKLIEWLPEDPHYLSAAYLTVMKLYELKARAGSPDYELQALLNECERNIKRSIDLLMRDKKAFQNEYIQHLQVLSLNGKYAELEKKAKETVSLYGGRFNNDQSLVIRELLGGALKNLNKYSEAISEYDFLLSQKPNHVPYTIGLAETQLLAGHHGEALALYKQLLIKDRSNANYIGKIGTIELLNGNYPEAASQLEKAVQADPSNKSFYGPLGEAYERTSNNQKAIDYYKLALLYYESGKPNSTIALEKLDYYRNRMAQLYTRMSDYVRATEIYRKLTGQDPKNAMAWYNLGTADLSAGLVYEAVTVFQTAQGLDPANAQIKAALQNALDLRQQVSANEEPLTIAEIKIPDVFPSLYNNYGDLSLLPIGDVIITNNTKLPIKYSDMSLEIPGLMTEPTVQKSGILVGYSNSIVSLTAIFSPKILELTQSQKIQAKLSVNYNYDNKTRTASKTVPITINERNAINWADKKRLVSFITQGAGPINDFARTSSEYFSKVASNAIHDNLSTALKLYTVLNGLRLNYLPDPELSYTAVSTNTNLIDFLQYPGETLIRKVGDCDDLVTLYCALLENSGVATAFIDVPGHIFMAIDLKMNPEDAKILGYNPKDIIEYQGKAWLPIETTLIGSAPFSQAWEKAATRYYQEISKGQFPDIVTLQDARKVYRPSSFVPGNIPSLPADDKNWIQEYTQQMQQIFGKLNSSSLAIMKGQYQNEPTNIYIKNKYAVLIAQIGQWDEAQRILEEAVQLSPENPSLYNNLGNIAFQQNKFKSAIDYYEKSYNFDKSDIQTLINLSKATLAINDKTAAKKWFDLAISINSTIVTHYKQLLNQIK